jgi:SAM-dependent methyltransferase
MSDANREPIFILGVPRSGTTLLRTILDSHPAIACGPETPWLGDHQPRSAMSLWRALTDEPWGYCASFNMPHDVATRAIARMVDELLSSYASARGKRRWAEKTPDNLLHIDALAELFPSARFIHLTRDALDVAVSTSRVGEDRRGIAPWHEANLVLAGAPGGERISVSNTPFAALLRQRHWNHLIERALASRPHFHVRYEELVSTPEPVVRALCDFLGERFDAPMLEYARTPHDYPAWEWGSTDVRNRERIAPDRIGRAARELSQVELQTLAPIMDRTTLPAPTLESITPCASLANVTELESPRFRQFMEWCNGFARPLGLRTFTNWSKVWEYPWLWFHGLGAALRPGATLVDLGSELSPMPWIAALLGSRVHLVETDAQFVPLWARLRDSLRVDVSWSIASGERLPLESASADVLTSFSVIEHQPDKRLAIDEAVRVLKPAGLFALSFDLCEQEMGMTFPEWNGRALTMREFERHIWSHPSLDGAGTPSWTLGAIPDFLAWHRLSAPHHNYITGAAALRKRS